MVSPYEELAAFPGPDGHSLGLHRLALDKQELDCYHISY